MLFRFTIIMLALGGFLASCSVFEKKKKTREPTPCSENCDVNPQEGPESTTDDPVDKSESGGETIDQEEETGGSQHKTDPNSQGHKVPEPKDEEAPTVKAFKQVGLEKLIITFSEPIKYMDHRAYSVFEAGTWNDDRTEVTFPFDYSRLEDFGQNYVYIRWFRDDAGNRTDINMDFPIDRFGPKIEHIKAPDPQTLEVRFNEAIQWRDESKLWLDGNLVDPGAIEANEAGIVIKIAGGNFHTDQSRQITVETIADAYGNPTARDSMGYSFQEDTVGPQIIQARQLKTQTHEGKDYVVLELIFDEYVVDERDRAPSSIGSINQLEEIIDQLTMIGVNDRDVLVRLNGRYLLGDDHRRLELWLPPRRFKTGEKNTITVEVKDVFGNKNEASVELVVQSRAPSVVMNADVRCEMLGLQSFRCPTTGPDIVDAQLKAEDEQPGYSFSVEEDAAGYHWLTFEFEGPLKESRIEEIIMVDSFGNESKSLLYYSSLIVNPPAIDQVTAMSQTMLEIRLKTPDVKLEAVEIDGSPVAFTLEDGRSFLRIIFDQPVPLGEHTITLRNLSRMENSDAVTESVSLMVRNDIQRMFHTKTKSLVRGQHDGQNMGIISMTLALPYTPGDLTMFEKVKQGDAIIDQPISAFQVIRDLQAAPDGSVIQILKQSPEGLTPEKTHHYMYFKFKGNMEAMGPLRVDWSTAAPNKVIPLGSKSRIYFLGDNDLDFSQAEIQLKSENQTIDVLPEWMGEELGTQGIFIPESVDLKGDVFTLSISGLKTHAFGIEQTVPISEKVRL